MKKLFPLLVLLTFFACKSEKPDSAKTEPVDSSNEWTNLFDGTSTEHWRGYGKTVFPAKGWIIEGEELVIQKAPKPRPEDFGGDIVTKAQFGNFELQLDFLVTDTANSGIFYFVVEEEGTPIYFNAPEYQILDDATYVATGAVEPNSAQLTGSNYDLQAPPPGLTKPVGEWNTARILHQDGHVKHWLNGQKAAEYQVGSPAWEALVEKSKFKDYPGYGRAKKGHIGLQDHDHEVRFRNIKIREI